MSEISLTEEETRTGKDETEDSSDTTSQIEAPTALRSVSPIARVKQITYAKDINEQTPERYQLRIKSPISALTKRKLRQSDRLRRQ